MTTPPQPRHARKRAAPAAAAKNRAASQAAKKTPKAKAPPPPPPTYRQQRTAARAKSAAASRAKLAARTAGPTPEGAALYAASKTASAARSVGSARIPTGDRRYQGVILAEFMIAVVVIAALPVVTGGSPNAKAKGSMSPYDGSDLIQLTGVAAVYFILALASSGRYGRFAAWFGGLVLIGIGFGKQAMIRQAAATFTTPAEPAQGSGTHA